MDRRKFEGPAQGAGGFVERETVLGGKRRKKKAAKKQMKKSGGFCIRAPTAGIMKTKRPKIKGHHF
jgi:hypothetical protein